MKAIFDRASTIIRDLVGLVGAVAVVHGVASIHEPSAWIVAGGAMVGYAWLSARAKAD